jgi:hypothetical protein
MAVMVGNKANNSDRGSKKAGDYGGAAAQAGFATSIH